MKRRSTWRMVAVVSAVLFLSGMPGTSQSNYTIRSNVRLVLLDVSVKDSAGGFVSGLSKDNFSVFENRRPQPITVFANNDVPVTLGILVDESFSMKPKRDDVIAAAETFIAESNPQDEIFVLNFNDKVTRGLPAHTLFSDNINQLRSALNRGIAQGKTALNDAIVAGLKQLELGRRDKKTLVVISDGGDNASQCTRAEMLSMVEESIATIYTIGIFDADDPDRNPGILNKLANMSGGEAYFPQNASGMLPVLRRIAKDIRTRYTIGYVPPTETGASNGGGQTRRIRVRVSAPGHAKMAARTRSSYRYDEGEKKEE